jgi:AcrR family transcriptional regulator
MGYKKSTIEKIAQQADVPVGLVTYYFKKDTILSRIYGDYLFSIVECIGLQAGSQVENHLQQHLLVNQIFYSRLVGEEANKEVYREIFVRRLIPAEAHNLVNSCLREMIREFNLDLDAEFFDKLILAEFGARRELLFHSYDKLHPDKDKAFFYFLGTITGRLAGIAPEIIDRNVEKADQMFRRIDTSGIHFLV